jgi:hypothetical protein
VVPVIVLVVGFLGFLAFRGGGGGAGIFGDHGASDVTPPLELRLTKAAAIPTTDTKADQLSASARDVATQVTQTIHDLYTAAFLDPGNWRDGSYDAVWAMFDEGSRASAEQNVETLTAGTAAGDTFDEIARPGGKVSVKVLTDSKDQPATAVAIVTFVAHASGKDGTFTAIVSQGQYFLKQTPDGWVIYSYSVGRKDHAEVPSPGPSGTPPAVAS